MKFPEKKTLASRLLFYTPVFLLGVLFYSMVHDSSVIERRVAMRYFLFGFSGLVAFILPYLSFPEKKSRLMQTLNLSPADIQKKYLMRHQSIWATSALLVIVIAMGESGGVSDFAAQSGLLLFGLVFLAGIYLYAASDYLQTGPRSQQWQEGSRGRDAQKWMAEAAKYPIDPGAIPNLLITGKIAVLGMMGVVIAALMSGFWGIAGEIAVAGVLFAAALFKTRSQGKAADRYFYHTNSFFSEFFGMGADRKGDREPLRVEQLWWIPNIWKTHSWALMLELDRRLPSGRIIALGHLFVWVLAYQRIDETVLLYTWGLLAVFHQGLLIFTAEKSLAPKWWLRHLDRSFHWVMSRFWLQVRWILPLVISMAFMKGLFAVFSWLEIAAIVLIYLLSALMISTIISFRHEQRWTS